MWQSGQWFGAEVVERIRSTVGSEPKISRSALSRRVCEWLDWRSPSGRYREQSCRKALVALESRGLLELPAAAEVPNLTSPSPTVPAPADIAEVSCVFEELGEVEIVLVSSRYAKSSKVWNGLMDAHHYLGSGPLCGAQLRYLVRSAVHGWLGGLAFSGATLRLKARDEWIGWSESAWRTNLQRVVCNSRFLIVPSVQVPNLASHVLGRVLGRLCSDWSARYGYEPVLVETFVDGRRFTGTCYRASGWCWLGQTAGREDGFANGRCSTGKKEIFVHPLRKDWRSVLCSEQEDRLGLRSPPADAQDWVEREFAGARLHDERLRRRLFHLTRDFMARPGAQIPEACGGSEAKSKAAYRFFDNDRVGMEAILRGHVEATAGRVREHEVVLAVQDTSSLNYSAHPTTEGLGPINTKQASGLGLILHDTMAFSAEGTPLGLLDVQCWARDPKEAGKRYKRKSLPIEAKESMKWLNSYRAVAEVQRLCPETTLVSVGDREADIYELFVEAFRTQPGPELLVRLERSRSRKVQAEDGESYEFLWDRMGEERLAGQVDVDVPRRGARAARTARLEVRFAQLTLKPPKAKTLEPVTIWAVHAIEVDCPDGAGKPLEWMLLTTMPTASFDDARERLRWYALRWGIEVYHRVIKSGCRIEDRLLNSAERIETCLAIDLVVAWRIYWLNKQGRETPEMPCDVFLEEDEWKVLYSAVMEQPPPDEPPTLREAVRMIATLGGFLGRKGDGEPGTTTLWRGLERLDGIVVGYRLAIRALTGGGPAP